MFRKHLIPDVSSFIKVDRFKEHIGKNMTDENDFYNKKWLIKIERIISIIANISVIVGIIFVFIQIIQSNHFERRRIAIETISQTRSNEFLKAYTRIKTYHNSKQVKDYNSLVDDINYVINAYDNIANLYINNLADKCIIKRSVFSATKELSPILDSMEYPVEYRKNFDKFIILMENVNCQ